MIVFEQNPAKCTHNHVGTFESVFVASALVHTAKWRQPSGPIRSLKKIIEQQQKKGEALGGAKEMNWQ